MYFQYLTKRMNTTINGNNYYNTQNNNMRTSILSIIILALASAGCQKAVPTLFSEADGIYFAAAADSISYSFAKYPNRTTDTLKIPVTVLGNAAGADRTISIEKITATEVNAVEGVHYKLLGPYSMPANKFSTTVPVVIYKTAEMDSLTMTFVLHLKDNEHFKAGITSKTSLKVKVAYLQKPPTWGEFAGTQWAGFSSNFGTWTKTKYKLILDALYDPLSDSTVTEFPYTRFSAPSSYLQYLQVVKNYIRTNYPGNYSNPVGIGATLRDPDANNNVIQVGPANY